MFVHENSCLIKIINNMIECTINGKSAALNLSNEQLQVLVSGKFGDGCLSTPKTCMDNSMYMGILYIWLYLCFNKMVLIRSEPCAHSFII